MPLLTWPLFTISTLSKEETSLVGAVALCVCVKETLYSEHLIAFQENLNCFREQYVAM